MNTQAINGSNVNLCNRIKAWFSGKVIEFVAWLLTQKQIKVLISDAVTRSIFAQQEIDVITENVEQRIDRKLQEIIVERLDDELGSLSVLASQVDGLEAAVSSALEELDWNEVVGEVLKSNDFSEEIAEEVLDLMMRRIRRGS